MSNIPKYIGIVLGVVVIGGFVWWIQSDKPAPLTGESIKIGGAFALSGDASVWGEAELNGATMAVEKINAKGGLDGKRLELVVEDTRSNSKDAVSAVQKLQNIDKVEAVLITWLDVYIGAESVLKPGNIMISPSAGVEAINGEVKHPGVFATWYRTQPKSELAVKYMAETGVRRLYLLTENDSYYDTVAGFMKEAAEKYQVQIIGHDKLNAGVDVKTSLTKIAAQKPDAVFVGFYEQRKMAEFLNLHKSFLSTRPLVFGDELIEQNYKNSDYSRSGFEDVYFYSPQKPDNSFFDAYRSKYNSNPIFGASPAYDSVFMIAEVLKDKPADVDVYMRSHTFETVSYGKVTFDELGGIVSQDNYFTIKQVKDGEAVDILK
jgi:branched-chain amino acid transport system substrate-binding protein